MNAYLEKQQPGSNVLHNMSSPPRIKGRVKPLRLASGDCKVTVPRTPNKDSRILQRSTEFPGFGITAHVHAEAMFTARGQGGGEKHLSNHEQLRGLVILGRRVAGDRTIDFEREFVRLKERTEDALREEYLKLAAEVNPLGLGLPAFALVARAPAGPCAPMADDVVLAILSRMSENRFFGNHGPMECPELPSHPFLLLVPLTKENCIHV
jgi:hypothetical protein